MLLSIVFGAVFMTVLGGLSMYVLTENRLQRQNASSVAAFSLAEAGLEYYRWHLAHFPNDLQNGTGAAGGRARGHGDAFHKRQRCVRTDDLGRHTVSWRRSRSSRSRAYLAGTLRTSIGWYLLLCAERFRMGGR